MDARTGTRTAEEPLYHADQIVVPEGLPVRGACRSSSLPVFPCASHAARSQEIMKEWTKECLRAQPADIVAWSASCVGGGGIVRGGVVLGAGMLTLRPVSFRYFATLLAARK